MTTSSGCGEITFTTRTTIRGYGYSHQGKTPHPEENLERGRVNAMKNRLMIWSAFTLFDCGSTFGQQPAPKSSESHKYRTIFTLVGGGGGFAVGLGAGLAAFDDAINSNRKVWTTAAFSAVGGAVGGYFLGRALDKRTKKTKVTRLSDQFEKSLIRSQWSALKADDSPDSWQAALSGGFADGLLAGPRDGVDKANQHLSPYRDVDSLYLVSQLRRIKRVPDLCTLKAVHTVGN
jgi:hypothetical protein